MYKNYINSYLFILRRKKTSLIENKIFFRSYVKSIKELAINEKYSVNYDKFIKKVTKAGKRNEKIKGFFFGEEVAKVFLFLKWELNILDKKLVKLESRLRSKRKALIYKKYFNLVKVFFNEHNELNYKFNSSRVKQLRDTYLAPQKQIFVETNKSAFVDQTSIVHKKLKNLVNLFHFLNNINYKKIPLNFYNYKYKPSHWFFFYYDFENRYNIHIKEEDVIETPPKYKNTKHRMYRSHFLSQGTFEDHTITHDFRRKAFTHYEPLNYTWFLPEKWLWKVVFFRLRHSIRDLRRQKKSTVSKLTVGWYKRYMSWKDMTDTRKMLNWIKQKTLILCYKLNRGQHSKERKTKKINYISFFYFLNQKSNIQQQCLNHLDKKKKKLLFSNQHSEFKNYKIKKYDNFTFKKAFDLKKETSFIWFYFKNYELNIKQLSNFINNYNFKKVKTDFDLLFKPLKNFNFRNSLIYKLAQKKKLTRKRFNNKFIEETQKIERYLLEYKFRFWGIFTLNDYHDHRNMFYYTWGFLSRLKSRDIYYELFIFHQREFAWGHIIDLSFYEKIIKSPILFTLNCYLKSRTVSYNLSKKKRTWSTHKKVKKITFAQKHNLKALVFLYKKSKNFVILNCIRLNSFFLFGINKNYILVNDAFKDINPINFSRYAMSLTPTTYSHNYLTESNALLSDYNCMPFYKRELYSSSFLFLTSLLSWYKNKNFSNLINSLSIHSFFLDLNLKTTMPWIFEIFKRFNLFWTNKDFNYHNLLTLNLNIKVLFNDLVYLKNGVILEEKHLISKKNNRFKNLNFGKINKINHKLIFLDKYLNILKKHLKLNLFSYLYNLSLNYFNFYINQLTSGLKRRINFKKLFDSNNFLKLIFKPKNNNKNKYLFSPETIFFNKKPNYYKWWTSLVSNFYFESFDDFLLLIKLKFNNDFLIKSFYYKKSLSKKKMTQATHKSKLIHKFNINKKINLKIYNIYQFLFKYLSKKTKNLTTKTKVKKRINSRNHIDFKPNYDNDKNKFKFKLHHMNSSTLGIDKIKNNKTKYLIKKICLNFYNFKNIKNLNNYLNLTGKKLNKYFGNLYNPILKYKFEFFLKIYNVNKKHLKNFYLHYNESPKIFPWEYHKKTLYPLFYIYSKKAYLQNNYKFKNLSEIKFISLKAWIKKNEILMTKFQDKLIPFDIYMKSVVPTRIDIRPLHNKTINSLLLDNNKVKKYLVEWNLKGDFYRNLLFTMSRSKMESARRFVKWFKTDDYLYTVNVDVAALIRHSEYIGVFEVVSIFWEPYLNVLAGYFRTATKRPRVRVKGTKIEQLPGKPSLNAYYHSFDKIKHKIRKKPQGYIKDMLLLGTKYTSKYLKAKTSKNIFKLSPKEKKRKWELIDNKIISYTRKKVIPYYKDNYEFHRQWLHKEIEKFEIQIYLIFNNFAKIKKIDSYIFYTLNLLYNIIAPKGEILFWSGSITDSIIKISSKINNEMCELILIKKEITGELNQIPNYEKTIQHKVKILKNLLSYGFQNTEKNPNLNIKWDYLGSRFSPEVTYSPLIINLRLMEGKSLNNFFRLKGSLLILKQSRLVIQYFI